MVKEKLVVLRRDVVSHSENISKLGQVIRPNETSKLKQWLNSDDISELDKIFRQGDIILPIKQVPKPDDKKPDISQVLHPDDMSNWEEGLHLDGKVVLLQHGKHPQVLRPDD